MVVVMPEKYTIYTSTTCTRCPLAKGSMKRAGVTDYKEVILDLPENEARKTAFLAELDSKGLRREVPVVRTPDGELLTNLATISGHFRELTK